MKDHCVSLKNKIIWISLLLVCTNLYAETEEDGSALWLRYDYSSCSRLDSYREILKTVSVEGDSPILSAIKKEIGKGLTGILDQTAEPSGSNPNAGLVIAIEQNKQTRRLGKEGYLIRTREKKGIKSVSITSCGEAGLLYACFHFLRLLQTDSPIDALNIADSPALEYRMLNQWDNLDRSVERGYSGLSIYDWEAIGKGDTKRYTDFARANASIGINAIAINNVNADPRILKREYLEKVAVLADIFREYNIRLFLSANYASPLQPSATPDVMKKWGGIGQLHTADPLDSEVIDWWTGKIDEIYSMIPDFGGFVVKANSEGMPGPQDYGRNHAEGANMLARILSPYKGIVVWRAFVYGQKKEKDRAKHAFDEFKPLDGQFEKNVFVQVKNGPLDFQAYEPAHPLFGAMPQTALMAELQITQEYLGHSTYLVYLGDLWKEFFRFDTKYGRKATVADILQNQNGMSGIAAVANVGNDKNWTGHHFAQANWFAYGRLAWNLRLDTDDIADDWIRCTWSNEASVREKIREMMAGSWQAFGDLQNPYGLIVTTDYQTHYQPAFRQRANKLWNINREGIGYNRTESGSNYIAQYHPINKDLFSDIASCPEQYLLFFHQLPWNTRLASGLELKEDILEKSRKSLEKMQKTTDIWRSLKGEIDKRRYEEVLERLEKQERDAGWFREERDGFFKELRVKN